MPNREELQRRLRATFKEEAAEHLQVLERELATLSADPTTPNKGKHLETVFRVMHTLKGAARSVRFSEIEEICQVCEALLRQITQEEISFSDADLSTLKRSTERLQELVFAEHIDRPQAAVSSPATVAPDPAPKKAEPIFTEPTAAGDAPKPAVDFQPRPEPVPDPKNEIATASPAASIRVDIGRLDRLVLVAEDLLLPSLVIAERVSAAKSLTDELRVLRSTIRSDSAVSGEKERKSRVHILAALKDIEAKSRKLTAALSDDQKVLRSAVNELFHETRQARMVPAATMLAAFPAMVRELCRATGKQAKWRLKESGVELDRKVIELVKDPLLHLVRNAIDHGIELPEEREAAGKPKRGKVSVSISSLEGGRVEIKISDDGRGMDVDALRSAAVRSRNTTVSQAQALSDDDVIDLAFRPGLSTSPVITSISGHGLGLSIVREQMERIDGKVSVQSTPGQGTAIHLELPSTIASYRGLLVSAGGAKLLWPGESVERVFGVSKTASVPALQNGMILSGNETLTFGRLSSVMSIQAADPANDGRRLLPCVVIAQGSRRGAFLVDEVLGQTDVLVKELLSPLRRIRNVSSAGLLASGELALVLRPADLLASLHNKQAEPQKPAGGDDRVMRILVVDDSITTRMMERNLFEAAGYSVSTAADGIDAWSALQDENIDIVVSDVDMPRMNGFELTSKIRADTRLADLPVVLVTALESRDDKERGIRTGANAYVLKSSFDQSNLLQIIGRLI